MTGPTLSAGGVLAPPAIDYTDKDYASLRQAMIDLATYRLPEWTDRSPADLGVLLIDLFAYVGDVISYYQDRLASEAFLGTAVERRSVMHLLRLIGYELSGPVAAHAELDLVFAAPTAGQPTIVRIPTRAQFAAAPIPAGAAGPPPTFEYLGPDLDVDLTGAVGSRATVRPDGTLLVAALPVRHSRSVLDEALGSATGEPNQRFALGASPVVLDTLVVSVDEGAGPITWTRQANLAYHAGADGQIVPSGPLSLDYTVEIDDEATAWVVFGDGVYGRRPPTGRANVRASYSAGGGTVGNAAAGTITVAKTSLPGLRSVTNRLPGSGGADAETIERAVRFGPLAFRSGDRAVTLQDYRALTLQAGGVAKVRAHSTGWNRVDLYVAPEGPEFVPCPPDLRQRLVAYFADRRMVGTSVRIADPVPVPVDISVQVVPEHHHDPETVRARALEAVRTVVAYDRVDFARPLYLSKVYEAVEALDGVGAATVTRFRRQDQAPPRPFLRRRGLLREVGLGDVDDLVVRAFEGAIPVEGRIDIGEVELPVPRGNRGHPQLRELAGAMRVEGFAAAADIVGRRIVVSWDVVPGAGETLADAPDLVVRRKERDFEFPPTAAPDMFLVYDSAAFPPAGATVTEIDLGGVVGADGVRQVGVAESAARQMGGRDVEVLRRTRTTVIAADGTVLRRREHLLDVDGSGVGLQPRTTYYYELTAPSGVVDIEATGGPPRAIATSTDSYGSARTLYDLVPAVHRRHDVVGPPRTDTGAVPEAVQVNGQLRRLMDVFGASIDHLRSRADGLRDLHDVDTVDARMLPRLASWLGWDLSHSAPIPIQRHEIRYAAQLYRITGTVAGCILWAKRLTGWEARVQEMWRTVLVSNDLGNPDDPADRGSRTLDTSDTEVLTKLGTAEDLADYSYETGPNARHAFNIVTFHATPDPVETLAEIARKRGRLLGNTGLFLPFNMRAALDLPEPVDEAATTTAFGLTETSDQGV